MSSLASYVRHFLSTDRVLYECRHCGETLEREQTECPTCGSDEIAEYDSLG